MGSRKLRVVAAAPARDTRTRFAIASMPSKISPSAPPSAASSATRSRRVQDLERLVARAALGTAGPRDLWRSSSRSPSSPACAPCSPSCRRRCSARCSRELDDLADVRDAIERDARRRAAGAGARRRLHPRRRRRGARRAAHDQPLRQAGDRRDGRARARAHRHRSLKVRYNRVFGYYIEISKSNLHAVPADYHRKQTIAGGERFITPALKEYEEKVLGADERILERELEIFEPLRARGRRRIAAHPGDGARARRRSTCSRRSPRPRRSTTTSSRTSTTATSWPSSTPAIRSSSGAPSRRRRVRAERHHAERLDLSARRS